MSGNLHFEKVHGSLTVLKDWIATNPVTGDRYRACKCRCACGELIPRIDYALVKTGKITNCGCLNK